MNIPFLLASVRPGSSSQEVEMKQEESRDIKSPKHSKPDPSKGLDERLNLTLDNLYRTFEKECNSPSNTKDDLRLEHIGIYFMKSGAPRNVIEKGILHYLVENERSSDDE